MEFGPNRHSSTKNVSGEKTNLSLGKDVPGLSLTKVSKEFAGNRVLRDVDFALNTGEVHALVGSNGSGKSTLLKMAYGVHQPSSGEIRVRGHIVKFKNPAHAIKYGIAAVPQELPLVRSLSVAENIFFGNLPCKNKIVSWNALYDSAEEVLRRVDPSGHINPKDPLGKLDLAGQQLVSIAKALAQGAEILLFDEPTSSLHAKATENLFKIIELLKTDNKSIAFISQRLDDIFAVADRITVLRDGGVVGKFSRSNLTPDELVKLMAGHAPSRQQSGECLRQEQALLKVQNLTIGEKLKSLDFTLHPGEILGIVGLPGSGAETILPAIFGKLPISSGTIIVNGKESSSCSMRRRIKSKFAYVSGDRVREGLVRTQSVEFNLLLAKNNNLGLTPIAKRIQYPEVCQIIKELNINPPDPKAIVGNLSGGNQQKVVIGRWLIAGTSIWLLDDPTRGVDVHARYDIHNIVRTRVTAGGAAIMTSSDLQEMIEMCDRLIVIYRGKKIAEINQASANEHSVLALASGASSDEYKDLMNGVLK